MSLFSLNSILEEEIFTSRNLGPDCDIIGGLLYRFGDKFILSALEDGECVIAVEHYLQLLDSLTAHFIADAHWCWFDDFYSPDYAVSHFWDAFVPHFRSSVLFVSLCQNWNLVSSKWNNPKPIRTMGYHL